MRVIGVNDRLAVGALACTGDHLHTLQPCDEERNEDHVEPLASEHQSPEWNRARLALHRCGKAEMAGDHPVFPPLRTEVQGSFASRIPSTMTYRIKPRTNDTAHSST